MTDVTRQSSTSPVDCEPDRALGARIDAVVERALKDRRIVGAVVLVARDGQMIHRAVSGYADREAGTPMREDAIFRLASVTKPFVSATIMRLVELRRLSLNQSVTEFLPSFRPQLSDGSTPRISVRHLLTHTSGLSYRFSEPLGSAYDNLNVSDGLDQPGLLLQENLDRLARAPLLYPPGCGWKYSLGLDVLGAVIEKISGTTLSVVVRDLVLQPLGLLDTSFIVEDLQRLVVPYADGQPEPIRMTDGIAVPFNGGVTRFAPSRALVPESYPSGGAGMVGTASEVLRFLEAMRCGGAPILERETLVEMTTDQVGGDAQTQDPGWGFGYGWALLEEPSASGTPQSKGTFSWSGAYGHSWFVDPLRRMTVVALTNTTFEGMAGAFTQQIRDASYG